MVAPHWFRKLALDTAELRAAQVSPRGGSMFVVWNREDMRCLLRGTAITVGKGEWNIDEQR
jgi:hypothetical protein